MFSRPRPSWIALAVLAGLAGAPASWAAAPVRRPTPHQRLDAALAPVQQVLDELRITEAERRSLSDALARGEELAAEQVESRQRGEHSRAAATERAIAILARVVRGRIEAMRAETLADERERAASEAEASAQQARGALERAAERRMVAERDAERAQRAAEEARARAAQQAATPTTTTTAPRTTPAQRPAGTGGAPRTPPRAPATTGGAR
ncbi:MAG: hypothetical protein JNK05_04160 [Myxococcales bacterium]|nr:hypothetical protein [Myxococcales bacterium]